MSPRSHEQQLEAGVTVARVQAGGRVPGGRRQLLHAPPLTRARPRTAAAAPRRLQSTVKSHKSETVLNYNDVYVTQHG